MTEDMINADNARHLTTEQVAETFVPCSEFYDLHAVKHTVVLGPRGCGKTTLLKMLTPAALQVWRGQDGQKLALPFTAVYVPTDIQWHHQIAYTERVLSSSPEFCRLVTKAAVTANVFVSVIKCLESLAVSKDGAAATEASVSRTMVDEWLLGETVPCFSEVRRKVLSRISFLRQLTNRANYSNTPPPEDQLAPFLFLDFLPAIQPVLDQVSESLTLQGRPWAVCFDELEMTPSWLQSDLFNILRCPPSPFLFKLTTAPIPDVSFSTDPSIEHDYDLVPLWPHARKDRYEFCNALLKKMMLRRFERPVEPRSVLGTTEVSPREGKGHEKAEIYAKGSAALTVYKEVAAQDNSFAAYLSGAGLNPRDPYTEDENLRNAILRKVKPLVYQRWGYRNKKARSRKTAEHAIYTGIEAIICMAEGNPRRLIRLAQSLISQVPIGKNGFPRELTSRKQASVVLAASKRFGAHVRALPDSSSTIDGHHTQVYDILKRIGTTLSNGILAGEFNADPAGSFRVDPSVPDEIIGLLRKALDLGAIVLCTPAVDGLKTTLRDERFRLSYMMAPVMKLPLRLYRPINLGTILNSSDSSASTSSAQSEMELELEDSE